MPRETYVATWRRLDNPGMNFTTEVAADNPTEAWDKAGAYARLSMGKELSQWTLEKLERVTPNGYERVP